MRRSSGREVLPVVRIHHGRDGSRVLIGLQQAKPSTERQKRTSLCIADREMLDTFLH